VADPAQSSSAGPPSVGRNVTMLAGVLGVAVVVLVALAWLSSSLAVRKPAAPDGGRRAGREMAPVFTLRSLRGSDQITLAEFRGKTVVMNFFASWCVPCELEAADLQRTWREYESRGDVVFLGVAIQDEYSAAKGFLEKHGLTYPAVFDAGSSTMQTFRITGIPTTVVIDPDGRVVSRYAGTFVGDPGRARLRARIDEARRSK